MHIVVAFVCLLLGCVHVSPKPAVWDAPVIAGYTGDYVNLGQVDPESKSRGFHARSLTGFLWPRSNLEADTVTFADGPNTIEVRAMKGNAELDRITIPLTNGEIVLTGSGTHKEGAVYRTTDRLQKTTNGLIIQSKIDSAGIFFIPLAGSESVWYFFPLR